MKNNFTISGVNMRHIRSVAAIMTVFSLSAVSAHAGEEAQSRIDEYQGVFKQPWLCYKTPRSLAFCGESVPLERRDVWERLDKQLLLALGREAQVILWLKRSRQYLPLVEEELKKQNLPDDLKYLAIAESDLNKYALSPKGAAGTWQFMEETGRRYGLEKEKWRDQRYCFEKSTAAALSYLTSLYEQFGQWMLAVAAYNCGEKRLAREIKEQNTDQFVDLYLPRETEEYLFRIMAIKIILTNPETYGFVLEDDDYYRPSIAQKVDVVLPDSFHLQAIAEAAQTSFRTIKELNPDLKGYYLPAGRHTLLIPADGVEGFAQRLSTSIARADKGMKSIYIVRQGETLSAIAAKLETPLDKLMQWNGIESANLVFVGQRLVYYRAYGNK